MFRKVMGISDELMWRYWELLTDKSLAEIAAMKAQKSRWQVKMRWRGRSWPIFILLKLPHQAQDDFNREVREGKHRPTSKPSELVPDWGSSLPKILLGTGMAESRTDAERKIKSGAVEIDGERVHELSSYDPRARLIRCRSARNGSASSRLIMTRRHFVWKLARARAAHAASER